MKGGKYEDKVMGPMFPRLHVNDTEKGGPRAPPRNKMALYEQLSVPSLRISSESASVLQPPNSTSLVPSISSSHASFNDGGGQERSVFNPICNSPVPIYLPEKLHSYSFSEDMSNIPLANDQRNSIKPRNVPTTDVIGHLPASFKEHAMKNFKGADDYRLPTFAQSEITDREKLPQLGLRSSIQSQTADEKEGKGTPLAGLKSRQIARNQPQGKPEVSRLGEEHTQTLASNTMTREKILADASSNPLREKNAESIKRLHTSSKQECRSNSLESMGKLQGSDTRLHHQCPSLRENTALGHFMLVEPAKRINDASRVRVQSCSNPALGHDHRSSTAAESCSKDHGDRGGGGNVNRNDDISDTSMMNCINDLDISPDDVVGVIGQKQFWKARKEIVHQQRLFAVQVFELHRLIKVQRLIAGSPQLLLEDNLTTGKPLLHESSVKNLPSEFVLESPPLIVKPIDDSPKPNSTTEYAAKNTVWKLPLPSFNKDINNGTVIPESLDLPLASVGPDTNPSPWCYYPPPGNHWLVPVMSPSEGLVYKPCSGPCPPPSAGFLPPTYGSCGLTSLIPEPADFLNPAYGVSASHQEGIGILPGITPLNQVYFQPYSMPVMNPYISCSAVEQMSIFSNRLDNPFSIKDINFKIPHHGSCNMSSQKREKFLSYIEKVEPSKQSELQFSTASSPSERAQGGALPLFPIEPSAVQISQQSAESYCTKQQTKVIKVVPHNRGLATESAARIFQSIQEERKQFD